MRSFFRHPGNVHRLVVTPEGMRMPGWEGEIVTIPAAIRKAAQLKESDMLTFEIKGDHLVVRKITASVDVCLDGVSGMLDDWTSPEDEKAWKGL